MVWLSTNFQYGTIPADEQCCDSTVPDELQYSSYSNRHQARPNSATVPELQYPSATVPARHCSHGLLQSSPLRTRRPRRVPDQPKYQDLLSWPRPIRLVLTVPCATSVRPVPTVPVRCPCLAHTRPHALASATTRPCSFPRTYARMCL